MGKFSRYLYKKCKGRGIPNLALILVICYAVGYILLFFGSPLIGYLTLDPYAVFHGQVWRLVTWLLIPPLQYNQVLTIIILLLMVYSISKQLESVWGEFYYTYYVISGIVYTIISSFIVYGLCMTLPVFRPTFQAGYGQLFFSLTSMMFTTYYIYFSLLLAFSATFPDARILLYFIIPIKAKYIGIFYGVLTAYDIYKAFTANSGIPGYGIIFTIVVIASLLNFLIFFLSNRMIFGSGFKPTKRQKEYKKKVEPVRYNYSATVHKCAICGRTSTEYPNLEYRFCSKCAVNYEYCNDHLFSHTHITEHSSGPNQFN